MNEPQGAFYIFPKVSALFGKQHNGKVIQDSMDLAIYLLEVGHVACVGGKAFGDDECIRMSYATSEDNIRKAFRRIDEAVRQLQ